MAPGCTVTVPVISDATALSHQNSQVLPGKQCTGDDIIYKVHALDTVYTHCECHTHSDLFLKTWTDRQRIGCQKTIRCNHRKRCSTASQPLQQRAAVEVRPVRGWKALLKLLQLVLSPHSLIIAKLLICVSLTSHTHTHSHSHSHTHKYTHIQRERARQTCSPADLFSFFLLMIHI